MPIVVYHEEEGVYLGSCMGLGFWSKLDPVGQDAACVFKSVEDFDDYIKGLDEDSFLRTHRNEFKFVEVAATVDSNGVSYALIAACVAAGLPAWDPNWEGKEL